MYVCISVIYKFYSYTNISCIILQQIQNIKMLKGKM